jgi:hypothetical protein
MTTVHKDFRGSWRAQDDYELSDKQVLQISTSKVSDGSIVTRATVHMHDGDLLSHRVFTDFSQCIKTSRDRCTAKNVATQHAAAVDKLAEIKEAVTAWYAKEEATA